MTKDISRRGFLGAAGGAAAAGALGPLSGTAAAHGSHGHGKGGDIPLDRIGIQLFTVRDLLADNELDLAGHVRGPARRRLRARSRSAARTTARQRQQHRAQFRALAERYDLKPEGSHNPGGHAAWRGQPRGGARRRQGARPALRRRRVAGGRHAADPRGLRRRSPRSSTPSAPRRAGAGLKFYFHNHPTDFALDGGTPIYDTLLAETDPRLVYFEMDIAWFVAGGADPRRLPARARLLALPALPRQGPHVHGARAAAGERDARPAPAADHAGERQPAEPPVLAARRRQGRHRLRKDLLGAARPGRPPLLRRARRRARRRDGGDARASRSPRPRNPAGSANTAWTSRKYLASSISRAALVAHRPARDHRHRQLPPAGLADRPRSAAGVAAAARPRA